jgi:hypothetical protein
MRRNNIVWSAKMRLVNVKSYLAQALRVPEAAIEMEFRFINPKTGKLHKLGGDDLQRPIRDLRILWS